MQHLLTADDFQADLHGEYKVQLESGLDIRLILSAITHFPTPGVSARQHPFSLQFESVDQLLLPQRIYRLITPQGAALDIFIVPISQHGGIVRYEAIFN